MARQNNSVAGNGGGGSNMVGQLTADIKLWQIVVLVIGFLVLFVPTAFLDIPLSTVVVVSALIFLTVTVFRASLMGFGALWHILVVFPATLIGALMTLTVILPLIFSRVSFDSWSSVAGQYGVIPEKLPMDGTLNDRLDKLSGFDIFSGIPTSAQPLETTAEYTTTTPARELSVVIPEVPIVDADVGGGVPTTVDVLPDLQPPTLPTPNPFSDLLADLAHYASTGDYINMRDTATDILAVDPSHLIAQRAYSEALAVEESYNARMSMSRAGVSRSDNVEAAVANALSGDSYIIVDSGAKTMKLSCGETAIIEQTTGALIGNKYAVARCLLEQFGVTDTNDVFAVLSQ